MEPNPPAATGGNADVAPALDRHLVFKAIVVVGAGVAAHLLWRDLTESPSKPTHESDISALQLSGGVSVSSGRIARDGRI
jgi:hypothetical protein